MIASVHRRAVQALAAAALFAAVLSGCAASPTAPVEDFTGVPDVADGVVELDDNGAGGAWLDDGSTFAVTLSGSSTCPPRATGYSVTGENTVTVTVEKIPDDKACTADFSPHTTVFKTEDELDPTEDLTVNVDSKTVTIPAMS
ncbi:MAG: hypothetical protein ABWY23_04560 [Mycetocola sp.]